MNANCYKIIFSKRLNALIVVGENATAAKKTSGSRRSKGEIVRSFLGASAFLGASLNFVTPVALANPAANALPSGGVVSQGQVSMNQVGNTLTIQQSSDKAVVNWQNFDIGAEAKVKIEQPSAKSSQLERISGNNATQIFGQLESNGQVVLVNPNGVVFGQDGSVSASSFTASTLDVADADFVAGKNNYANKGEGGTIANHGNIKVAAGGYVALLGAKVSNDGKIIAPEGSVALGAAEAITVPVSNSGKIQLELSPEAINAAVTNSGNGVIVAEGGQVYLQAAALNDAAGKPSASVTQSGVVDVSGAQGGSVTILADEGQIKVDGNITANSTDATKKGGDIIIGRDTRTEKLAKSTDVSGATLESKEGFVETSGEALKSDNVNVKAGEWLIDPSDITISSSADSNVTGTSPADITPNGATGTSSVVQVNTIQTAINAGTNVTIKTTNANNATGAGNITIANPLSFTNNSAQDATLSLIADNGITQNASITATGSKLVNVNMTANGNYQGITTVGDTNSKGIDLKSSIAINGAISVVGTSQTNNGVATSAITANSIYLKGTSNNNGLGIAGIGLLTTPATGGGNIIIEGNSSSNTGVQLNNVINSNGNVTIKGTSQSYRGVVTTGGTVTANGAVDIVATSVNGNGFAHGIIGAANMTGASIKITGSATGGRGIFQIGQLKATNGDLILNGVSTSDIGAYIDNSVVANQGSVIINGTSVSSAGIQVNTGTNIDALNYTVKGISSTGNGIYFPAGTSTFKSTSISVDSLIEAQNNGGNALFAYSGATINLNSGSGKATMATSASNLGNLRLGYSGGSVVNTTGDITIGSHNDSANLFQQGTINALSGKLTLKGKSSADGIQLQDGGGAPAAIISTNGASITLDGISTGSGNGVNITGTNNSYITASGTNSSVIVKGASNTGTGVRINTITSDGAVSIIGSATGGAGSGIGQTGAITASTISLNGTSVAGAGMTSIAALNANKVNALTGNSVSLVGTSGSSHGITSVTSITSLGPVIANGTSNGGVGWGISSVGAISGTTVSLTGSSIGGYGITTGGAINATAGGVTLNGTSAHYIATNLGHSITATGDVVASGISSAWHGLFTNSNITSSGGNITLTGSTPGGAVGVGGSGAMSANKDITINGTSRGYFGISGFGALSSTTGNISLTGTSNQSLGINFNNTATANNGTVTVVGTSNGPGTSGIQFFGTSGINTKSYSVNGTSDTGSGVYFANGANTTFTSTSTSVDSLIQATKNSTGGNALYAYNGTTVTLASGSGKATMATSATSKAGIRLGYAGGSVVNTSGDITIGAQNSNYANILLQGTINATGGKLTINGKASGDAIQMQDGGGTPAQTIGTNGAIISLNGESTGSGSGINMSINSSYNSITSSGSGGSISLVGNSANGNGVATNYSTITSNNGNPITIIGNANTAGTGAGVGVYTANAITANGGGNLVVTGTSKGTGSAVQLNGGSFTANSGNVTVTGTATGSSGLGGMIGGTVTGGVVSITGSAVGNQGIYSSGTGSIKSTVGAVTLVGNSSTATGTQLQGTVEAATDLTVTGNSTANTTTNPGVLIQNVVKANTGDINVTGTTKSAGAFGVWLTSAASTNASLQTLAASKSININTDSLGVYVNSTVNSGSTGFVNINTTSPTRNIGLGSPDTLMLGLDTAELGRITASNVTIGNTSNTGTISVLSPVTTVAGTGNIDLKTGGNIAFNALMTVSDPLNPKTLILDVATANSTISNTNMSGSINAANLEIKGANAAVSLQGIDNNVGTLAANIKSLVYVDTNALTLGTVNSTSGVTATGNVSVSTKTNDLTLAQNVSTTGATLLLNAGQTSVAGVSTGGNIIVNAATVTVGAGGTAQLMTGSIAGSTTAAALASAGNFRYNSDESATNYSTALSTGVNVIYREMPLLTIAVNDVTKTYDGAAFTGGSFNTTPTSGSLQNGDTFAAVIANSTFSGTAQNKKNVADTGKLITAADTSGKNALGYGVTYTNGTLTINKAALNITANSVTKTYDGDFSATGSSGTVGTLQGTDSVNNLGMQVFLDKNAGPGKTVRASGVTIKDATNVDMTNNYDITYTDNATSVINQANLTVKANNDAKFVGQADVAGFNGVTYTGLVPSESSSVLTGTLVITRTNASVDTVGTYANVLTPSGLTSNNYNISYETGNYQIIPAGTLLVRIGNTEITYGDAIPAYTVTAQYLDSSNDKVVATLNSITPAAGNNYAFTDGVGGSITGLIKPYSGTSVASTSTSGNTKVGNYVLNDLGPPTLVGSGNFSGMVVFVGNLTVNPKAVTPSITNVSKVYDGGTSMTGVSIGLTAGDVIGVDHLSISGTGTFTAKKVGTSLGYTISGLTLGDADSANYYVSGGSSLSGTNGEITPKNLTASFTASNKEYDRLLTASVVGSSVDIVGSDAVTITNTSATFDTKDVGPGKTVTVLGIALSGMDKDNYTLQNTSTTTTAAITKKAATVTGTLTSVEYNKSSQTQAAAVTNGFILGDDISVSGLASGTYSGTYPSTLSVSGADKDNYDINITNADLVIGKKAATVSTTALNTTYDMLPHTQATAVKSGFISGDDTAITVTGEASATNAGTYSSALTVSGVAAANYDITTNDTSLTIAQLAATLTGIATSKTYSGASQDMDYSSSGFLSGDAITFTGGSGRDAGTYPSDLKVGGTSADNYVVAITNANLTISKLNATATAVLGSVTYNGAIQNQSVTSNFISSDAILISGQASARDASTTTPYISALSVSGADAGNYNITLTNNNFTINKANLTVTASQVTKTYDGGLTATGTGTLSALAGAANGDAVLNAGSQAFAQKDVGTGNKIVQASGVTIKDSTGTDTSVNYNISYVNNATSTINKAALQEILGSKTYDGLSTIKGSQLTSIKGVGTETFTAGAANTAAITGKDVVTASNKVTSATGLTLTGNTGTTLVSNYDLSFTPVSSTVTINKAQLQEVSGTKTYDGLSTITGPQLTTIKGIGTEAFTATNTATITGKDVSTVNNQVTAISGLNLTGTVGTSLATNYDLAVLPVLSTVTISKAALTATANSATYTYNGSSQSVSGFTVSTLGAGDTVGGLTGLSASGAARTNVGTATNTMTVVDQPNYTVTGVNGTLTISAAPIVVTTINGALQGTVSKEYNGSDTATLSDTNYLLTGWALGEGAVITKTMGTYDDPNVGTNKTVTVSSLVLGDYTANSGTNLSNYTLPTSISGHVGTITAKEVSLSAAKTYNGGKSLTGTQLTINTGVGSEQLTYSGATIHSKDVADNSINYVDAVMLGNGTGGLASNYKLPALTVAASGKNTVTLSQAKLQEVNAAKTYDGLSTVTGSQLTSINGVGTETFTAASTDSSTITGKDVVTANNKVTNTSGLNLTGNAATTLASNYNLTALPVASTVTISKTTLQEVNAAKTYDGLSSVTGSQLTSIRGLGTETFTAVATDSAAITGKDVVTANNKVTSTSGLNLTGNAATTLASNYDLTATPVASAVTISKTTLQEVNAAKTYDGLSSVKGSQLTSIKGIGTETFTAAVGDSASITSKDVVTANNKVTSTSSLNLTGNVATTLASNYNLTALPVASAVTIGQAALTIKVNNTGMFVTQDARTALDQGFSYTDFQNGETAATALTGGALTAASRTYTGSTNFPTAGTYTGVYGLSATPTSVNNNYRITVTKGDLTVTPADKLLITIASQSDLYGNRTATNAGLANSGVSAQYCLVESSCSGANLVDLTMTHVSDNQWKAADNTGSYVVFDTTVSSPSYSTGGFLNAGNFTYGATDITPSMLPNANFTGRATNGGVLTISPKALIASFTAADKTYNGDRVVAVSGSSSDLKSGDVVSFASSNALFDTKNFGVNKPVTISGISLSGADAGNYSLPISTASATASITKALASVTAAAESKTYNAAQQIQSVNTTGFIGGDAIVVSGEARGVNVGNYPSNLSVGGTDAGNYTITITNNPLNISAAPIVITAINGALQGKVSKEYDGNNIATLMGSHYVLTGWQGIDGASVTKTTGTYDNANAGSGKTVTVSLANTDYLPSGATSLSNYSLPSVISGNVGEITKAALVVRGNSGTVTYNAVDQSVSGFTVSGLKGADTVSILTGISATGATGRNVGDYPNTVTVADQPNYKVTGVNGLLRINAAPIVVTTINGALQGKISKEYDGNNIATLTGSHYVLTGWQGADGASVTKTTGTYDNANAGSGKTVTVSLANTDYLPSGATSLSNYSLPSFISGTIGQISKAPIVVTGNSAAVKYNGATQSVSGYSVSGLKGTDTVSVLTGISASGATGKNVGDYPNTVTVVDQPNYTVTGTDGLLSITKREIDPNVITEVEGTLQGTVSKVYDGTNIATLKSNNYRLTGWQGTDGAVITKTTGVYDNANAGSAKTVTVELDFADYLANDTTILSNYSLPTLLSGNIGQISKAPLIISGIQARDKVYDGNTQAKVNTSKMVLNGLVQGDEVVAQASGAFDTASVGKHKAVNLSVTHEGRDLDNYAIVDQLTAFANITTSPNKPNPVTPIIIPTDYQPPYPVIVEENECSIEMDTSCICEDGLTKGVEICEQTKGKGKGKGI